MVGTHPRPIIGRKKEGSLANSISTSYNVTHPVLPEPSFPEAAVLPSPRSRRKHNLLFVYSDLNYGGVNIEYIRFEHSDERSEHRGVSRNVCMKNKRLRVHAIHEGRKIIFVQF